MGWKRLRPRLAISGIALSIHIHPSMHHHPCTRRLHPPLLHTTCTLHLNGTHAASANNNWMHYCPLHAGPPCPVS